MQDVSYTENMSLYDRKDTHTYGAARVFANDLGHLK